MRTDLKKLLSFVIPCYRSELTIKRVIEEIDATVAQRPEYEYEIICINDASPDRVLDVLYNLASQDERIKVVNLAKNMGKHAAVLAGYSFVRGEYVVNLDDDFQCPTYELWSLLAPLESGEYDIATASYLEKKQAAWKNIGSNINARIGEILLEKPHGLRFENFCIVRRFVADEMAKYPNAFPYLEGLMLRITRRVIMVPMEERERGDGQRSGYTFRRSVALFSNGFTAFSVKPLRLSTAIGFLTAIAGFFLGIVMFFRKIINPNVLMGYTSIVVLILFMGGLILISLGLLGEYVGRIYICINRAPQYVIRNTCNLGEFSTDEMSVK